jgi:pilus assembly protein CpaB
MAKKRAFFMITSSLILGVAAAWMAGDWLERMGQVPETEMATVVAADLAIPFGTKVARRHLKLLEMPNEYAPPGAFRTMEAAIDRVTVQPIVAGEILMQERFIDYGDGSTLAAMVAKNMRAVTVRVDDVIGVAGFLLPGNRVDVLASRREQNRRATAETILRDIKVLAVDQTAATEKNEPVIVRAVTLEVKPEDAETLFRAREEGSIQLTLRNPLDEEIEEEPIVAEEKPEEPAPAPVAPAPRRVAPAPTRSFPVTIIRGTSVSEAESGS